MHATFRGGRTQDLDDAKGRLTALTTVARNMVADVIEKKDNTP
jgi:hypothetical protein